MELLEVGVKEDAEAVEVDVLPASLGHRGAARLGWGGGGAKSQNQQSPGWGEVVVWSDPRDMVMFGGGGGGAVLLNTPQKDQFWGAPSLMAQQNG